MAELITCKNCNNQFSGKFCNLCGEKVYADHDKSLKHFFEEAFHFVTHFDSKFLTSLRLVFFYPGFVSKEISLGVRKKYYKPVSLFLVAVIIYLLFPVFRGMNISFGNHVSQYNYMGLRFFVDWVLAKAAAQNIPLEQLAENFNAKSEKVSKLLLILVIPLTGLLLKLLFWRKKKFAFDHLTLAAEINTFFLFLVFLVVPLVLKLAVWVSYLLGMGTFDFGEDMYTFIFLL